jgi:hypothetical protein
MVHLIKWKIGCEVETPIGEDTGDGSTHPARCRRAGYQFDGLPQGQAKVWNLP